LNGQPREVNVRDRALRVVERAHPKADPADPGQVAAPPPASSAASPCRRITPWNAAQNSHSRSHENAVQYLCAHCRTHREILVTSASMSKRKIFGGHRAVSSGQLRKHEKFRSRFLRNQRDVIVYTPPGYDDQPGLGFPVLYLQDGQNLFDGATSSSPARLARRPDRRLWNQAGVIAPLIIVGIYNTKARIREYTPTHVPKLGGGRADRYAKFVIEEVKPFIDREYRTLSGSPAHRHRRFLAGRPRFSYIGLKHPRIFGKIAALSPSVWWNQHVIHRFARMQSLSPAARLAGYWHA